MNPTYKLQRLNESLNIFDLKTTINEPTRVTHNTQTCIDNIITNLNHGAFTTRVHKTQISDHYGISITLNQSHWLKKEIYKECRIGLGKNEPQLRYQELLENETWEKVYQEKDLNTSYAVFEKTLNKHFNFVFTKKYVKQTKQKNKPQETKEIIESKQIITYLHELNKYTTEENRKQIRPIITSYTNQHKQLLIDAKKRNVEERIASSIIKLKQCGKL